MSDDLETVAVPTPFGMVLVGMASNRRLAALSRQAHGEGAQRLLGVGTAAPTDPIVLAQLRALASRACLYVPAARDSDRALLQAIERAIASGVLAAVFIPRAPLGPMVEGPRVAPQMASGKPFKAMSATERIAELLRQTPAYLGSDLAAAFRRMVTAEALAGIAAAFAVLLAAQFLGVGEIADAALAYWAYTQAGLSGLYGLYEALRAVVDAVRAPDEVSFKDAVRRFADGLSLVGVALLTAVVTRAARRRAAGSDTESGAGGAPEQPAAPVRRQIAAASNTARVVETRTADAVNEEMAAAGSKPAWRPGTDVATEVVPPGTRYNMVVSEGQAQALMDGKPAFGAWATPSAIPSQAFARNQLAILPEFKPDVSYMVTVETTAAQTVNSGITGAMDNLPGGASQVQFLGGKALKLVGSPVPLPPE